MKNDNKQVITVLLTTVLGWSGAHHFYNKRYFLGVLYLFTFGLFTIGWIVDIFKLLHKSIIGQDAAPTPTPPSSYTDCGYTSTEKHHVAGPYYYRHEIEALGTEHPDYFCRRKDFIDIFGTNQKVYKYSFCPHNVQLIEEPENPYDPNAIKVVVDNHQIGHIKKESCSHVKKLMRNGRISNITCKIGGGEYRICTKDNKEKYHVNKHDTNYYAVLTLFIV